MNTSSTRDGGFALVYVMTAGMVASLLVTMLLGLTISSNQSSRRGQDYQAAVAAAQAGVDDYLARLNANTAYWQTTDCANIAMQRPMTGTTPPCGYSATTAVGWKALDGSSSPLGQVCSATPTPVDCARFHYDIDATGTPSTGKIVVTSTGRSRNVTRTVRTTLVTNGFADFLYFSDIESADPSSVPAYGQNVGSAQGNWHCDHHYYDSPSRNSQCKDITFVSGDVIDGPLHTNDALLLDGTPSFRGPVTTGYPACAPNAAGVRPAATSCYRDGGSATPSFSSGIGYAASIQLPPTNTALRAQVVTATANGTPGCLYTGPTRIKFNNNGTMNVWSPYTVSGINSNCGGTSPSGTSVPVPANNVIYVQNVPSSQASPTSGRCADGTIGGYPVTGDDNVSYGEWDCRSGIAVVEGVLKGRVTVNAENNIIITNNLTYQGGRSTSSTDSLGLIANNSVEVYHPVNCAATANGVCSTGTNLSGSVYDIEIDAAVLSLQHSFTVQSYQVGAQQGTITVYGSISQKYRGAVGTYGSNGRTGYYKNYSYDTRLRFAPPPYYLDPVQSSYRQGPFSEIPRAY